MIPVETYDIDNENEWCPGCGNFGILKAVKKALSELDIPPHEILVVSGIGQAAKTPHFMKCSGFHSLHGRALPLATGAKIANHALNILVHMGDGDCYGEGGNHFMHAVRRNIDVTAIVHDNRVFGLTKGQASPTSAPGMITKAQPHGVVAGAFNPLAVALVLGAGFVAQGFSGKPDHLSALIQKGIRHKGFSLINVLQPCVSFNPVNTHQWYAERVYPLEETDHRTDDLPLALQKAMEGDARIPIGVFYAEKKPSYTDRLPALEQGPLLDRPFAPETFQTLLDALF